MKKSLARLKLSKIPKSKTNKINFELSLKTKNRFSKMKYDSINKETIDGSFVDTLFYYPDSLNNSKTTFCKNNSLGNFENKKLLMFTSSLKYDPKTNLQNLSKGKMSKKTLELFDENTSKKESSNILIQNNEKDSSYNILEGDDTDRIDYRYYPKIPEIEANKENKYYWIATFDKLMKKSKIIKILNYYIEMDDQRPKEKLYDEEYNFKEKTMIINGFEIYYLENFNKPFIRPKKGKKIFIKLYLFNTEQINKIYSYINRLEYKSYISDNDLEELTEKNLYKNLSNNNRSIYNYSIIFFLGTFMNINIYAFTNYEINKKDNQTKLDTLPSSSKLAKLIKVLMLNFPEYSKNNFINYLTNFLQDNNVTTDSLNEKKREISSLISSGQKRSLKLNFKPKISTNSVIKNVINKIPTYTISSHKTPNDFMNVSENNNNISDLNNSRKTHNINSFDFFNNIKSDIGIPVKKQISEKIFNKLNSNSFCFKKKINTKNIQTINHSKDLKNKLKTIKNEHKNISKNINNISIGITHDRLTNPLRMKKNNRILDSKYNFPQNICDKENNMNILNSYLLKKERINSYVDIKDNFSKNLINTEINKQTRNKINPNFNPFYFTNTNNSNNNLIIAKKSKRVISSIRKIISQKLNNISVSSNSIFKNLNINTSHSSLKGNVINGNKIIYSKLGSISNNNSKNKKIEYITPRKKRLYYYYH